MDVPLEEQSPSHKKTLKPRKRKKQDRPYLEPNAAGIDAGAREMFVAVPPGRDKDPVRVFGTFTEDLQRLADWPLDCGVTTVALESTGVYWIPLYEILALRLVIEFGTRRFAFTPEDFLGRPRLATINVILGGDDAHGARLLV